jgi:glycosyltransferase involved in cell wall biosynthesis
MNKPNQTLCLTMIVRNESRVIERCLASVHALISAWVIVDTGSTDGTQAIVRHYLDDVEGELIERPWVDFAHNRTEALTYARGKADYLLIIDADEVLSFDPAFRWPELTEDAYSIETRFDRLSYRRVQLVKNTGDWYYCGVLHEYITASEQKQVIPLHGVVNLPRRDGARSADPHKFKRDALTLEQALLDEPDNARYVFYLAQSYRDAGEYELALKAYQRRAAMDGDPEERWYARYQGGLMRLLLGEPWEKVLNALLEAYADRPTRAEPLYRIATYYRERKAYPLAALFAQQALSIDYPTDNLFVETSIYAYGIAFEYAICCYWAGQHTLAIELNNRILETPGVAADIFDQAIKNRQYSLAALYPKRAAERPERNRIRVLVPFRNPGANFDNCIASLLEQDYPAFDMVFVDHGSADGSHEAVPIDDPRVALLRFDPSQPELQTIHTFLTHRCRPDDILVYVDGADWLADEYVLSTLNNLYNAYDCWVLYGQYREANGRYGHSQPYPDEQAFRQLDRYAFPHLIRTFRADLYQHIRTYDPGYVCMKDARGNWRKLSSQDDRALMTPLLRQAGFERVRFNDQVLYVLNTDQAGDRHEQP